MEAIIAATKYGGQIMGMGDELGMIKEGYLADLLLVDGDPVANVRILQDKNRILAIMKDGKFHRAPKMSRAAPAAHRMSSRTDNQAVRACRQAAAWASRRTSRCGTACCGCSSPSGRIGSLGDRISKKTFVNAILNGVTLAGLYFLVASGFTLVFGLMRNVNLAHGSLYLLGAYVGYDVANMTGFWLLGVAAGFAALALVGAASCRS